MGHDACGGLQSGDWLFPTLIQSWARSAPPTAACTKCSPSLERHNGLSPEQTGATETQIYIFKRKTKLNGVFGGICGTTCGSE